MEDIKPVQFAVMVGLAVLGCTLLIYRGAQQLKQSKGRAFGWWLAAPLGPTLLILTKLSIKFARRLAKHSAPDLRTQATTITALVSGVLFMVIVLGALLPTMLDFLERQSFTSFVAARHVRATKSGFLTVISILSMAGVGVSSCALCGVTSIMGGFGHDLKAKLLANNGHIVVDVTRPGGFGHWPDKLTAVRAALTRSGGGAATPVVGGEAMASSSSNTAGALVRGIDPETIGDVIDLKENIEVGSFDYFQNPAKLLDLGPEEVVGRGPGGEPYFRGPDFRLSGDTDPALREFLRQNEKIYPGVIIGRELAKSLHVLVSDEITLLSPMGELGPMGMMPRSRKFRVAGIFYSGMYEYDATHAYVLLHEAQSFFSLKDQDHITQIDIRVPNPEKVAEVRPAVLAAMAEHPLDGNRGAEVRVRDWMEMNKNLFSALALEKIATFIILSIAILVASFCIVCTLLLMVTEKGKEIAILKALGASDGAIMSIFMREGIIIGSIGTAFGVGTALASCTGLAWFGVRLDPEVYYIDRLPVNVNGGDYAMVALAALVICTVATIYPAYAASQLRPVDGLRWE